MLSFSCLGHSSPAWKITELSQLRFRSHWCQVTLGAHSLGHETVVKPNGNLTKKLKWPWTTVQLLQFLQLQNYLSCCMTRCSKTKKGHNILFQDCIYTIWCAHQTTTDSDLLQAAHWWNFGYKTYKVRSSIGWLLSFDPIIKPVTNNLPSSYGFFS